MWGLIPTWSCLCRSICTSLSTIELVMVQGYFLALSLPLYQIPSPGAADMDSNYPFTAIVKDMQLDVYTWRSWALQDRVGSRWKRIGFSLCAAPSWLAGPCISESWQSWVEMEVQVEGGVEVGSRVGDQRSKIRGGDGGRVLSRMCQIGLLIQYSN
jgi:hypothetical protein